MAKPTRSIAILPGTFDPITSGHVNLIRRGLELFDELIVAIGHNPEKAALFSLDERRSMIESILKENELPASVQTFEGLTMDFAQKVGATVMLRGIRNSADLQFEIQLALTNRVVADIETVFILADEEHGFTSSSLIKQIAAGGRIDRLARLLPKPVIDALHLKLKNNEIRAKDVTDP